MSFFCMKWKVDLGILIGKHDYIFTFVTSFLTSYTESIILIHTYVETFKETRV